MKKKKNKRNKDVITYLQLIQSNIDRMATSSAIFKGFAATIVTGVSTISYAKLNKWILLLSFIPVLCFMMLDIYYLQLERRYRFLYELVRIRDIKIDFDLRPPKTTDILKIDVCTNTTIRSCLKSPSIILFYAPIIVICGFMLFMKFCGCLG